MLRTGRGLDISTKSPTGKEPRGWRFQGFVREKSAPFRWIVAAVCECMDRVAAHGFRCGAREVRSLGAPLLGASWREEQCAFTRRRTPPARCAPPQPRRRVGGILAPRPTGPRYALPEGRGDGHRARR